MNETIAKAVAETMRGSNPSHGSHHSRKAKGTAGPKKGRPAMKQPTFNWEMEAKYSKLKTFRLEVNNILSTYNTPQTEQLATVKNWLGRKGLQFLETLTNESCAAHRKSYSKHLPANLDHSLMKL